MRQPQLKPLSKSMFCFKGKPEAILLTETPRGFTKEAMWFPHPVTALEWCLKHDCNFTLACTAVGEN